MENSTVPPARRYTLSGLAMGASGPKTTGVIKAVVVWPVESATAYFTEAAVPMKFAIGTKETIPDELTEYVPSNGIVIVVKLHKAVAVAVVGQNLIEFDTRLD